jgi:PAS domain S-box-containing protein
MPRIPAWHIACSVESVMAGTDARVPSVLSGIASAMALLLGALVLAGWWFDVPRLVQPVARLPGMVPNTAASFVLLGLALLVLRQSRDRRLQWWLATGCVLLAMLLEGAMATEYITGHDIGIDHLLFPAASLNAQTGFPPGRSAPGSAAALLLLGAAVLIIDNPAANRINLPEALAGNSALIALLALAGFVYGATSLYGAPIPHTGMAPHTVIGIMLLNASVVCLRPEHALMRLIRSPLAGGLVVRRLLLGALTIPALGLVVMLGLRTSLYSEPFAAALLAVVAMAIAVALVLMTGRTLDRIDSARTESEQKVAEREERLRDLIDAASDGIFIADLDGRYTEVNNAGCLMLGYRREEIVGKTIMDLLPPGDVSRLQASKRTLLDGGRPQVDEWSLRKRDGTYLQVEVSAKILPDGRWQGLVRDISARKHLERASNAVIEAIAGTPESSVRTVLQTVALQAQLATDADYVALGLGHGENGRPFDTWVSIGTPPYPNFHGFPQRHPPTTNLLGAPIRSRGVTIGSLYLANKRGVPEFSADDQRAVEQLASRVGTIIETARLYQAEGLERAWLESVIDQMPEGVILTDADGAPHAENRAIQDFALDTGQTDPWGRRVRYDLRRPDGESIPVDEQPQVCALVDGTITSGQELALRHPDGRLVPMLVSAVPVSDTAGRRSGAVTIFQNITILKEFQRLRDEWTSVVAHDLRQPLHVIAMDASVIAAKLERGQIEEAKKPIQRISRSAQRLNTLINDLLDVSLIDARRVALDRGEADLASWIQDAIERFAIAVPGHRIQYSALTRPAPVSMDPTRIEQVLGNLLSNAAKYGEPEGHILVTLTRTDHAFEVSVSNRGQGIAPGDLHRVFQRFARSETTRGSGIEGLGLGLYICRGLIEAHGGRIWVDSVPGETTTFHFTLPELASSELTTAALRRVGDAA